MGVHKNFGPISACLLYTEATLHHGVKPDGGERYAFRAQCALPRANFFRLHDLNSGRQIEINGLCTDIMINWAATEMSRDQSSGSGSGRNFPTPTYPPMAPTPRRVKTRLGSSKCA